MVSAALAVMVVAKPGPSVGAAKLLPGKKVLVIPFQGETFVSFSSMRPLLQIAVHRKTVVHGGAWVSIGFSTSQWPPQIMVLRSASKLRHLF